MSADRKLKFAAGLDSDELRDLQAEAARTYRIAEFHSVGEPERTDHYHETRQTTRDTGRER